MGPRASFLRTVLGALALACCLQAAYAGAATTPAPASVARERAPSKAGSVAQAAGAPGPSAKPKAATSPNSSSSTNGGQPKSTEGATPNATPAPTTPFPAWSGYVTTAVGAVLFALLGALAFGWRAGAAQRGAGPALLATIPLLAFLGLLAIPFAPNLGAGNWIPVEALAVALFVAGAFLGFLYGLPVIDPDAVKAAAASAGTFLRPGTKLDAVIDSIMPVLTGGVLTYAITQAAHFNTVFLRLANLPSNSSSQLLGMAILAYFTPLGFILSYSLTSTVGALAFKRAQETLVLQSDIVRAFPNLPDLPNEPTDDERAAAATIAKVPYASLRGAAEKATWARAQTILKNYPDALKAYQDAIVLDPRNAPLILDYATAIYNEPDIDDVDLVLQQVDRARSLCGPNVPPALQQRINALTAAAKLYKPGSYEDVIVLVNGWISSAVPTTPFARFYRACAFGQLYESNAPAALPNAPPFVTLPPADDAPLKALVRNDVALTLVASPDAGPANVKLVMDPGAGRTNAQDDDMQLLAADDPQLRAIAGIANVPPAPAPPHPPPPTGVVPDPATAEAGTLGAWIAANCPT